jgi:hypothetical protein
MVLEPVLLELRRARNGSVWSPTGVKRDVKRLCSSRSGSYTMRYEWAEYPFKRTEVTFFIQTFCCLEMYAFLVNALIWRYKFVVTHYITHNTIVVHYQLAFVSLNIRYIEKYLA